MKMVECRELSVEGQSAEQVPRLNGTARSSLSSRRGFTLVELLITIMIIGILAAAVLGVAAVAGETAREARTRNLIARIHTLLMQHYETYTTRRVKVRQPVIDGIAVAPVPPNTPPVAYRGKLKAEARLYALREMMLMEVPDRWSDVLLEQLPGSPPLKAPIYLEVPSSTRRTSLGDAYLRQYRRIVGAVNKITGNTNTNAEIIKNQGAECLYMVVMNACGDGESRTLFPESMIGDTDGDGANEFVDGWGHPIEFLRSAPGYESDAQINAYEFGNPPVVNPLSLPAWVTAASSDHDPFDLYRADLPAFRLLPLVYSAGRDETYSIEQLSSVATWTGIPNPLSSYVVNPLPQGIVPKLLPWQAIGSPLVYLGADTGENAATDNLNNHLIGTR